MASTGCHRRSSPIHQLNLPDGRLLPELGLGHVGPRPCRQRVQTADRQLARRCNDASMRDSAMTASGSGPPKKRVHGLGEHVDAHRDRGCAADAGADCRLARAGIAAVGHADLLRADVGDRGRRRQRPHGRADDRHQHPRRDFDHRARRRAPPGRALRFVRRAAPDAVMALSRMLASLHDDDGELTVGGLHTFAWPGTDVSEAEFREEAAVYPDVQLFGRARSRIAPCRSPPSTSWRSRRPAPTRLRTRSCRARPRSWACAWPRARTTRRGQKVAQHLRDAAPWGVRATVTLEDEPGKGYLIDTSSPVFAAARTALQTTFDHEVLEMGSGGSIPLVPVLVETFPGIEVLIWGAADHLSNYHSRNESVDLRRGRANGAGRGVVPAIRSARAPEPPGARLVGMSDEQEAGARRPTSSRRCRSPDAGGHRAVGRGDHPAREAAADREAWCASCSNRRDRRRWTSRDASASPTSTDAPWASWSEVALPHSARSSAGGAADGSGVPTEAELRVAQAQLVGWLEGLFHGIQAAMFAQQAAAQAQFQELQRRGLLGAEPQRRRGRPQQDPRRSGQYL